MSKVPESKFKSFLAAKKEVSAAQEKSFEEDAASPVALASTGRPSGKRSDPSFEQVTAYIRRDTYRAAKIALLQEGRRRQFSELVEQLVGDWVRNR
jgi:hypothetical protein